MYIYHIYNVGDSRYAKMNVAVRDGFVFNPYEFFQWSSGNGFRLWTDKLDVAELKNNLIGEAKAVFTAPLTGNYSFYVSCINGADLYISSTGINKSEKKIATCNFHFPGLFYEMESQISKPMRLVSGEKLFMRVRFWSWVGEQSLRVGVKINPEWEIKSSQWPTSAPSSYPSSSAPTPQIRRALQSLSSGINSENVRVSPSLTNRHDKMAKVISHLSGNSSSHHLLRTLNKASARMATTSLNNASHVLPTWKELPSDTLLQHHSLQEYQLIRIKYLGISAGFFTVSVLGQDIRLNIFSGGDEVIDKFMDLNPTIKMFVCTCLIPRV